MSTYLLTGAPGPLSSKTSPFLPCRSLTLSSTFCSTTANNFFFRLSKLSLSTSATLASWESFKSSIKLIFTRYLYVINFHILHPKTPGSHSWKEINTIPKTQITYWRIEINSDTDLIDYKRNTQINLFKVVLKSLKQ
eukprot:sb/3474484/